MNKEVYEELRKIQNVHWWFVAKREIVLDMFEHFCQLKPLPKILDVGCGMGLMLESLQEYGEVYGLDASYDAVEYCRNKCGGGRILFREPCRGIYHLRKAVLM
ncbi:MAG: class I SAM-dependent methyltransferase [Bacteroides sp.]